MGAAKTMKTFFILLLSFIFPLMTFSAEPEQTQTSIHKTENWQSSEAKSDRFEVLLKYPEILPGKASPFILYLSNYATNLPIKSAQIEIEFDDGQKSTFKSTSAGVYQTQISFKTTATLSGIVSIVTEKSSDLLVLEDIHIGPLSTQAKAVSSPTPTSLSIPIILSTIAGVIILVLFLIFLKKRKSTHEKI